MQVRVLFFGILKDLVGRASDELSLPDHAIARDVLAHYEQQFSRSTKLLSSVAISVNQQYARPDDPLRTGDEVALLPPVSGGTAEPLKFNNSARAFITREKIDSTGPIDLIKRPEDGAVAIFEGIVRNHTRKRRTIFLEYEAYEEMAIKQMNSLIEQALGKFAVRDAIIIHRLGRIEISETSVLIVVASAHRAAAFDACRWLIDNLKSTVPIWKKEHFEDGAVWSDGEPFPELSELVGRRASPAVQNQVTNPEKLASNPLARK
ncbi:MAG TPA: molybdenum cofactor biosynthesis protein MoaE [Terriglobales bacterium]|nr:molybdenum cofactor biosynthesis protein MoaE [Terriglobales bacterium]